MLKISSILYIFIKWVFGIYCRGRPRSFKLRLPILTKNLNFELENVMKMGKILKWKVCQESWRKAVPVFRKVESYEKLVLVEFTDDQRAKGKNIAKFKPH